ncbi:MULTISPECIES: IS607 family transposase [unclassified Microcoleus]|uniref:IS607 family transposase n=1 Tax=unclassified Microcoleus TaxID=2642155 RepID=UPI002FD65B41
MYLSPAQAQEKYGYHPKTLADWADDGKIEYIRSKGGHRRYLESSIVGKSGLQETTGLVIIYARVSTHSQKNDLESQATALKANRQGNLIREIGSGMNFKRKKFIKLMERVGHGEISEIVVAHKDRLCRFGFEFVEWYCSQNGCKITVLGKTDLSPHAELMQDFMSVMHCFSSRLYFLRRYKDPISKEEITTNEKSAEPIDESECIGVSL